MKKALAILMVLAAITGVAVADVADIAVSGFAKLTWGVDFDNANATGFKQGNEWDISIPLLATKTFTTKGEGDAYATISIVDAEYYLNADEDQDKTAQRDDIFTSGDKKIDKVTAQLVFGNVSVTIANNPSFKTDNASIWAPIKNDVYFDGGNSDAWYPSNWVGNDAEDQVANPPTFYTDGVSADKEGRSLRYKPGVDGGAGVTVGYKAEKYSYGVKLASKDDKYESTTSNRSVYAIGADLAVMPSEMISVAATANYLGWKTAADSDGKVADGTTVLGAKVVVTPIADLSVNVGVDASSDGFDFEGKRAYTYDASATAKYKFVEAGVYYGSVGTPYSSTVGDYEAFFDGDPTTEALFLPSINGDFELVSDLAAFVKFTATGLVPNVDGWATVMAYKLLSDAGAYEDLGMKDVTAPIAFGAGASYKYMMGDVNYAKPFAEIFGQNMSYNGVESGTDFVYAGNIGVEYGLFTNAIITAKYASGATQDDKTYALIKTPAKSDKGDFTLACKITY